MPEVDHPGIPATIVVEDGLAEVLLEGESLGRWSLYDVHAARLVSSAFSISLDGEEITFIADEPVDFAYKGVEHMAGVWARYKSMTMPRRVVAVGRSRRGTTPSRIPELREAMLSNLRTAGRATAPIAADPDPSESAERLPLAQRLDAYSNVPAPMEEETADEVDDSAGQVDVQELAGGDTPEPGITEPEALSPPVTPVPLRPGPGLIPRQVTRITPVPSSQSTEPLDWEAAWVEPPEYEDDPYEDLPPDADLVYIEEEAEPVPVEEQEESIPQEDPAPVEGHDPDEVPGPQGETAPEEVVLDLGRLEGDKRRPRAPAEGGRDPDDDMVEPDLELLFAGAPVPAGERSGLFGAVRSAFARNKGGAHEHQFVEAPGGIGIVRQICADCGYISIGVAD